MRHAILGLAPLVFSLALIPAVTTAQDWSQPWADPEDRPPRVDLSASTGFVMPTSWSSLVLIGSISPVSGVLEQVLARDLRIEPETAFSGAVTYWRGRYGFRTQAGFSRSSLSVGGSSLDGGGLTSIDVDTWLYDVRAAVGFSEYAPRRWVWPYGFFGFGGITYNLEQPVGPPLTFVERGAIRSDGPEGAIVVSEAARPFILAIDELRRETVFAVNFGLGADFRIPLGPAGFGLRFEVSDHVASSPVGLRVRELSRIGTLAPDAGHRFGLVHHLSATAGVMVQIGR